jgi:hypothetical protein
MGVPRQIPPVANSSICGEPDTASNNLQRMAPRLLLVTNQLESSGPDPGDQWEMGRDRGRVLGVHVSGPDLTSLLFAQKVVRNHVLRF